MSYKTFSAEVRGAVMTVRFAHPPVNLMDRAMMEELRALLTALESDGTVKVVVFKSANPDFFIAHADLTLFDGKIETPPPRSNKLNFIHRLFEGYRKLPKATMAVIEGRANGAGTEFALSLDMQFASYDARIGQFEVALGVLPGGTGTQRLPWLMGRSRALELILGCDDIDGKTAADYGLVNRALPTQELSRFVDDLCARIATFPLKAIALAKASVDAALGDPTPALIEESFLAGQLVVTDEVKSRFRKINELGAQTLSGEMHMAQLLTKLGDN